jgi:uridine kinase
MTYIIGISGGSGSGKTTFARMLTKRLGELSALLYQDSYYIDQSAHFDKDGGAINFDHPSALDFQLLSQHLKELRNGSSVDVPVYDFVTHSRIEKAELLNPHAIIVVDGILVLSQENCRNEFDEAVYISTTEEERFSRRLKRDIEERGRTPEGVREQFFSQVKPMHDTFVNDSKKYANAIYSGHHPFDDIIEGMAQRLTTQIINNSKLSKEPTLDSFSFR